MKKVKTKVLATVLMCSFMIPTMAFANTNLPEYGINNSNSGATIVSEQEYYEDGVLTHEYVWTTSQSPGVSTLSLLASLDNVSWVKSTATDKSSIKHRSGLIDRGQGNCSAACETISKQPDGSDNFHYSRVMLESHDSGRKWAYGSSYADTFDLNGKIVYKNAGMTMRSYWGITE